GMIFIVVNLVVSLINMFRLPDAQSGVAPVLPIPVEGAVYVPFFYWILCIFIIAIVHEMSHGIVARHYGIRIKSSGFAFLNVILPIVPAAFVEPDENQLEKKKLHKQLGVFAAGPFSNIILGFIALAILALVINPLALQAVDQKGILITNVINGTPAYEAGLIENDLINMSDDVKINTIQDFTSYIDTKDPGDEITLYSNRTSYTVTLGERPDSSEEAYMGINFAQKNEIKQSFIDKYGEFAPKLMYWIYDFFYWLFLLNLGIGLFNLVPLGPVDGGRMIRATLLKYLPPEKASKIWKWISYIFLAIILYMVFSPWLRGLIF
ncbi:MAG: M50 family metallopeptidase, partial [Candidatus Woesearchaeota archaeon]